MLRAIASFLSPAAFEQRHRDRRARALRRELDENNRIRARLDAREPYLVAELERIAADDLAATLDRMRDRSDWNVAYEEYGV